jgi:hypothetical protein
MTKKQERVPGTTETRPNREQRRHPDDQPEDAPLTREEHPLKDLDVPDPRTTSGQKKKTADNWNQ